MFVSMSTYTKNPLNLTLKGDSSIGKSWYVVNVTELFPAKDVISLGGMSPRALIHMYGELEEDPNADPQRQCSNCSSYERGKCRHDEGNVHRTRRDDSCEYINLRPVYRHVVNLERKVIAFLETPDPETLGK